MSPDKEFMSAYLDGEIPSPWKERFDETVAGNPECRETLARHRLVHEVLQNIPEPDFEESMDRSWAAVCEGISDATGSDRKAIETELSQPVYRRRRNRNVVSVWRRRIAVPVPMVAAAAALVVFLATFVIVRFMGSQRTDLQQAAMAQTLDGLKVTVNVKDVEQLLDILNGQNKIREVNIQLPEPHQFRLIGEPLLLRASDNPGGLR